MLIAVQQASYPSWAPPRPLGKGNGARVLAAACLGLAAILGGTGSASGAASGASGDRDTGTATIGGQVILDGPRPRVPPVPVWKHREFCGDERVPAALRLGPGGVVSDALVILEGEGLHPSVEPGRVTLDNRDCEFAPRVQVASVGSELEVLSSDPILHTAHAYLDRRATLFHVALPVFLSRRTVRLDRPGLVTIECDVGHTWMRAFIWVTATGFAAVTDAAGSFRLHGVPPGRYRARVWHEVLGERALDVGLVANQRATLVIRFGGERSP